MFCVAVPAALCADLLHDIKQHDQQQQLHVEQLEAQQQQTADLESQLAAAHAQALELEVQLEVAMGERGTLQETAAELMRYQGSAKQQLLEDIRRLQEKGQINAATRCELSQSQHDCAVITQQLF